MAMIQVVASIMQVLRGLMDMRFVFFDVQRPVTQQCNVIMSDQACALAFDSN